MRTFSSCTAAWLLVLIAFLAGPSRETLAARQNQRARVDRETLEVMSILNRRGLTVTRDGEAAIRKFLSGGRRDDSRTKNIEENLKTFAAAVADSAHFSETAGKTVVDASSVDRARSNVCPLYPWC